MTTTSVSRSLQRGNTFVPPTVPLPGHEQGKVLHRLGYSLAVCVTDAQAAGWVEADEQQATGRAGGGRNG